MDQINFYKYFACPYSITKQKYKKLHDNSKHSFGSKIIIQWKMIKQHLLKGIRTHILLGLNDYELWFRF